MAEADNVFRHRMASAGALFRRGRALVQSLTSIDAVAIGGTLDVDGTVTVDGKLNVGPSETGGALNAGKGDATDPVATFLATSGTHADDVLRVSANRNNSSAYRFIRCYSDRDGGTPDAEFILRGDGEAFAEGSWTGGGADYAEMLENAEVGVIEPGTVVTLDRGRIRPANEADDLSRVWVISAHASVVGNNPPNWPRKYLRDSLGRHVRAPLVLEIVERRVAVRNTGVRRLLKAQRAEWAPTAIDVELVGKGEFQVGAKVYRSLGRRLTHDDRGMPLTKRVLNPEFDPSQEYVVRSDRPAEWSKVALLGVVPVKDGQPVNPKWEPLAQRDGITDYLIW